MAPGKRFEGNERTRVSGRKMASSRGGGLRMSSMVGQVSYDSSAQQSCMPGPPGNTGSQLSVGLR